MKNILVTGATGNVGKAVIDNLRAMSGDFRILAGIREPDQYEDSNGSKQVVAIPFDFEERASYESALSQCDVLFLLRPPQLADVQKYFAPIIDLAQQNQVAHIVFLSVQGAEKNSFIPHHKIEKLIELSAVPYTFLRPAYFMQNFTTTLRLDIVNKNLIFLPAGKAKFNLVDAEDVGKVAAHILVAHQGHRNQAYDLTNQEQLSFGEMAAQLSEILGRKIQFVSPSLWRFFWQKKKEQVATAFILVMIMLHYLPRFQKMGGTSLHIEEISGQKARSFRDFIASNKSLLS